MKAINFTKLIFRRKIMHACIFPWLIFNIEAFKKNPSKYILYLLHISHENSVFSFLFSNQFLAKKSDMRVYFYDC